MSCPEITIQTIQGTECIGDSLPKINSNFNSLETATCNVISQANQLFTYCNTLSTLINQLSSNMNDTLPQATYQGLGGSHTLVASYPGKPAVATSWATLNSGWIQINNTGFYKAEISFGGLSNIQYGVTTLAAIDLKTQTGTVVLSGPRLVTTSDTGISGPASYSGIFEVTSPGTTYGAVLFINNTGGAYVSGGNITLTKLPS